MSGWKLERKQEPHYGVCRVGTFWRVSPAHECFLNCIPDSMHKDRLLAAAFARDSISLATVDQTIYSCSKHLLNIGYAHCVIGN